MQSSSLFSGVEELAQFERATLEPLKIILSHCSNVEHLSLDMPARVLDERNHNNTKAGLTRSLKELITLHSVYGGDLNEVLWDPGSLSLPRWNNLTHLQLHGPRFQLTTFTALAITQLPNLAHLGLIMPLLIQPHASASEPDLSSAGIRIDNARDALGRCNVLQIFIDALGHQLKTLLLVCHDIESYVGNVQRLGSWLRTLHWRCSATLEERGNRDATKLVLVTARPKNPQQTTPHPSLYSKWMLQRAEQGVHWDWSDVNDVVGLESCEGMNLSYIVESWTIPIIFQKAATKIANGDESQRQRPEWQTADNNTARRWLGIGANEQDGHESSSEASSSEGLSGLDNLD